MSNIEENSFKIARFFVENGEQFYTWGDVRNLLNISPDDFTKAYNFLYNLKCCHNVGIPGDQAMIFQDSGMATFYTNEKRERVNIPEEAETLLKYLVTDQTPDFPFSQGGVIMKKFDWNEDKYMEISQILCDEGFIEGRYADGNPFYTVSVLPEGRKTLKENFHSPKNVMGPIYSGDITTNINGSNNILTIDSILFAAQQSIKTNSYLSEPGRNELESLLKQLDEILQKAPAEKIQDAEAVAELAKDFVEKATNEKPNPSIVKISAEGLKKAAENIAGILPPVLTTVLAIISFIEKLPPLH